MPYAVRCSRGWVLALVFFVATVSQADAQTGTITGRVVQGQTLEPLTGAQVFIPALDRGTLAQSDGGFVLANVPAGTYTVRAERIGLRAGVQEVTVGDGETVEVSFQLGEEALALDEIIVTGTAGGTRQRAIGNVVSKVDAATVSEVAPVSTLQDLIEGRAEGVTFQRTSGNVGTGAGLRVRGYTSLGVSNQPLIYIDGVRIDNNSQAGPALRDGAQVSKMDDINPDDIQSIEIIKGPAAATLYGTEASNGVIQIITKRGAAGAPRFDLSVRQGANWLMNADEKVPTSYGLDPETGQLISFNIWDQETAAGRPFFQTGYSQAYNLSMTGGSDAVRYFLSADYDDAEGIVDYNWNKGLSLRANISVVPSEKLKLDVSTGYVDGTTSFMQQKTNWGVWEQAQWSTPEGVDTRLRGFLRARPEEIAKVQAMRDNSRFIGSGTLTHTPRTWFTQRLVLGLDEAREENRVLFPRDPEGAAHDFGGLSLGNIEVDRPYTSYTTADYAASVKWGLLEDFALTSSFGVQYYAKRLETVFTEGRIFPAPAIRSLAGAAVSNSTEQIIENKTLGGYIQQEIGWKDRVFLTAAVRGDDNSAFGAEYDAAIYPKLSATWVVSEEPWFQHGWLNTLRLRSAWGKAGQQPDVFAAVRLYAPAVGPDDASVVTPAELGNPELGPEISEELEVGFEGAIFDNRLTGEFTYYTQKVTDALIALPVPPSRGFPGTQFANLGQVSNWGWEVGLTGQVIERPNFGWELGVGLSHNENRVDDMGGRPPTSTVREGYPFPALFTEKIVSAEIDPETGRPINIMCDGGTGLNGWEQGGSPVPCDQAPDVLWGTLQPDLETTFTTTLTFLQNLRLYGLVEWRKGGVGHSTDVSCRHTCFQTSRAANVRDDAIFLGYADTGISGTPLGIYDAGFAKLREVSATYQLPGAWIGRVGMDRASVTVAGRNLWTMWVAQEEIFGSPIHDPEARRAGDLNSLYSNSNVPPTSTFVVTMRVSF